MKNFDKSGQKFVGDRCIIKVEQDNKDKDRLMLWLEI